LLLELQAATLSTQANQIKYQYMKRELNRSAVSGKIVSRKFAKNNPSTTVKEKVSMPTKEDRAADAAYINQSKTWIAHQTVDIMHTDTEIKYLKDILGLTRKKLQLAQLEKKLRVKTMAAVKKQMQSVKNRYK
jgi:hypothetical protein